MKVLRALLLVLFSNIFVLNANSQTQVDSEIKAFIFSAERIRTDSRVSMYAYEVYSNEEWNLKAIKGIYRIGAFIDHSYTHLLFIDGNKKHFINTYKGDIAALQQILSLFEECDYKYSDKEKLLYIQDILNILENNKTRIPW